LTDQDAHCQPILDIENRPSSMDIGEIAARAARFRSALEECKQRIAPREFSWYPYDTFGNFGALNRLLSGQNRDLLGLIGAGPAVDIGAADGDVAFFMESLGIPMHIVDHPPTNFNSCRGVRTLKEVLQSKAEILETDLDRQFTLPNRRYSFAFFLGILYHLKNPFGALEALAEHAQHAVISTRVARYNVAPHAEGMDDRESVPRVQLQTIPMAYLLDPAECNNDATNYWIFSEAGLRRILSRTGWEILDFMTLGNDRDSDPASPEGDERAFCLVRSRAWR
jgi:hypothetical protein